jgi:hypothetical protein
MIEKKGAAKGELGGAMAVGHEAEVADAVEAVGQRMKKEAADELVGLELHDLCCAVLAVNRSAQTIWFSAGHEMPVETRCTWKARTSSSSNRSGDRPK